jgi:hypothetical protein
VVLDAWYDRSVFEVEVEVAVGLSTDGIRTLWCETVGHAGIAQDLPISMRQGGRLVDAPTDCGLIDDGVAAIIRSTVPWLLALVTSCLLLLTRPWLVARLRWSIEHGHPRWAGCWSSVAACLPVAFAVSGVLFVGAATQHGGFLGFASLFTTLAMAFPIVALVVAAITGAVMASGVLHAELTTVGWRLMRMALGEVILGAVITASAIVVLSASTSEVGMWIVGFLGATVVGLIIFGAPMLLATGAHVLVWRWLLAPAVGSSGSAPTVVPSIGSKVVTPA